MAEKKSNTIEMAIFAKKQTRADGRVFYRYLSHLKRADGTEFSVQVRFRGDERNRPQPEACPMNIIVNRETASLSKKMVTNADGEVFDAFTLWVGEWKEGEPYVDHSLDDII